MFYLNQGEVKSREAENYTLREMKRTYKLPANAEVDKLASYMAPNGKLMIEIPLAQPQKEQPAKQQAQQKQAQPSQQQPAKPEEQKQQQKQQPQPQEQQPPAKEKEKEIEVTWVSPGEDMVPRVTDGRVEMRLQLPEAIEASKVKVTCKDNDLVVTVRDEQEKGDKLSEIFFYRRTTLPDNTDLKELKCTLDGNLLTVKAPLKVEALEGKSKAAGETTKLATPEQTKEKTMA